MAYLSLTLPKGFFQKNFDLRVNAAQLVARSLADSVQNHRFDAQWESYTHRAGRSSSHAFTPDAASGTWVIGDGGEFSGQGRIVIGLRVEMMFF